MRIVLLTENTYCGGLDSFIVSLVEAWPDPTDELMLICNHDHPGLEVIRRRVRRPIAILGHAQPLAGRCLRRLHRLPGGNYLAKAASPLIRAGCFLAQLIGMGRLLAKVNPDRLMIINGGYPAGDSCRAATIAWDRLRGARPKAIHNIHNLAYPPRWWDRAAEQAIDRRVGRAAAAFVAVSRACAEALPANRPAAVAAGTPVTHIYNGIADPPAAALGTDVRAALGIPAAAPLAVMLGTYEPRKGHEMLIAAFARVAARVPTAHLVICGHGYPADRERVDALVAAAGLGSQIHTLGFRDDVSVLLTAADVLAVASQAFESFGLTLVEAMAQRVPVVATRVGGVPEVVGEEDEPDHAGFLVAHDDVAGYADRLTLLLLEPRQRRILGEQGFARYRRLFTAEAMARAYAAMVKGG